jgi:NADH-quinone oxidoreductase subunit G
MTAVARRADVVFPVAPVVEKTGTFVNWEGRLRTFERVLDTPAMSDARVLDTLAREFGVELGCGDTLLVREELAKLPVTSAPRSQAPTVPAGDPAVPGAGEAVLASWHQLIDLGSLLDGDKYLAGTARPVLARLSKDTAAALGVAEGDPVTVGTKRGAVTLPAAITADLLDGVVWVPTNSPGSTLRRTLGVAEGAVVTLTAGKPAAAGPLLASAPDSAGGAQ